MLDKQEQEFQKQIHQALSDENLPNQITKIKETYFAKKEKKIPWYKNKLFYGIGSPILAAAIVLAIVIPLSSGGEESISNIPPNPITINGNSEQLAFSLLSTSSYINNNLNSAPLTLAKKARTFNDENQFGEYMADINPYMLTMESMLKNNFNPEFTLTKDADYLNVTYDYLMEVRSLNSAYEFYYNEVDKISNDSPFDDDEDEIEQEFHVEGVVIIDQIPYQVRGDKEIEIENDESEYELTLRITIDDSSYLLFEEEKESETNENEQSYTYSYYLNNRLISSTQLEFEEERGQKETVINYEETNNYEASYLLFLDNSNNLYLNYEIEDRGAGLISITIPDENHYLYLETRLGYEYLALRE